MSGRAVVVLALASFASASASRAVDPLLPSLPLLVAARFATGATVGAIVPLAIAWIGDVVPYERRQPVLARFLIGNMMGIALSTAISGWLGELYGWRAIFFALAGLYLLIAGLLWFELQTNPLTRQAAKASETIAQAFLRMIGLARIPWVRVVLAVVFIEGVLLYGPLAFAAYHAHRSLGLGIAASGTLIAAFAAGGLLYVAVAGRLVPRLGERGLVLAGGLCIGIGYIGLALAPGPGLAVLSLMALGAGLYMLHTTLQLHATQMAPESRGAAVALFAFCLFSGQSAGVWLAALVVDTFGTRPLFAVAAAALPVLALEFRRRLVGRRPSGGAV